MFEPHSPNGVDAAEPERDWVTSLEGESGRRLRSALGRLPLAELAKYPVPRRGRLPFGPELSILSARVRGRSVQLQPSGFARAYRAMAAHEPALLYRAFTVGEGLTSAEWSSLLGRDEVPFWERSGFLVGKHALRSAFRIVAFDRATVLADAFADERRFENRVHVGKDTVELLERMPTGAEGRYLDVGTGSGALLLAGARGFSESIGIDVNPRAVAVARFNAELNGVSCRILDRDVFALGAIGRFDRITWNLPFHFFPEDERGENLDGDGGDMGIELTLKFFDVLPTLLADSGSAYLLTSSPTLDGGTDLLADTLSERAPRLGLDVRISTLHALWSPSRRRFHRAHGIHRIDNVAVEVRPGSGVVRRIAARPVQRALDWVQGLRYGAVRELGERSRA